MWYPPENTGGEGTAIKSYTMYIRAFDNEGNLIQEPLYTIENIVADETNTNAKGYITYVVDKDQYPLSLYADYKVSVAAYNTTVNTIGQECDMLTVTVTGALADTAPGSPTGITAEAGNQQVRLSWNAPIYDGGGIDNYYIYYGVKAAEGASQSWKRISVSGNKTDEIVSGLVNDTEYVFYITACNRNGESDPSFTTSATPLKLDAPSAVTNLRYFSTADNSQIVFRWDASTGEQVKYRVYITNLGTGGDAMSSEISATALTLNVLPGVQYRFEVEAFNAGGTSPKAGITAMSTLNVDVNSNGDYVAGAMGNPDANFDGVADPVDRVTVPGEPTNLRANVSGTSSINLSWAAPENTGGKDTVLSKYRVYVDGTYVELDAHDSDGTPVTSYRYDNSGSGIKPGSVYTFQVSALNEEAGEGSRSSTLQVYVQASDAPAIVEATVSGYTTLNLTWTPPQTTDEVEGYYLQLNGLDGTAPLIGTGETDDGNITYSAATLTPDTETVVRVFAKFKDGHTGKYSDAVIVSSKLETPAAPVLTSAEANVLEGEGKDAVTVQWEAVPGATSYKVYLTGSVDMPVTQEVFDATTATITIDSTPGTYTVYVTALNAPGGIGLSKESARSAMKTVTTLSLSDYAPAQVENVNVSVDRADQTVTLSWDPVALPELSDGNTCFTGIQYVVYGRALSASTLSGAELQTLAVTDTPEAIVPVELNREYAFQVMAFNVYDETAEGGTLVEGVTPETLDVDAGDTPIQLIGFAGLRSDLVEASTENQTPVPGAPENLSYSYNAQTGEVTLSWTAPSVNGENVTGYKVYGDYQGGTQTVIFDENNLVNALTCTFTVAAEEGKTDYMYQVSAVVVDDTTGENEYIEGAKSAALTVSTEQPPANPDAPSITRYVFRYETVDEVQGTQKGMITLYWKAPTDLEKEANNHITAYTVLLNNGEVAVIDLTDEAVDSSTYYNEATGEYFYVFDCNEVGIFTPDAYEVAVRATAVVDAFTLHSGLQEQAYKIAFGNNEDTDGDGVADKNLDENGDGIVEDVVITVRLNGTVTAGGSTREVLVFTLLDESGNEVTNDRYTLEVQDDGSFSLALKVSAASQADAGGVAMFALLDEPVGGYTLKVSKDGCTSYTITDIPLSADIAEINLGIVTLYAGDVNGDGIVDFLDDNVVALNYNLDGASVAQGDVNGDGVVDFLDSNTINLNYNKESITKSWT